MGLIPLQFFDCVVAIGVHNAEGKFEAIASGFLYGHLVKKLDETRGLYLVFLVTNRHVFEGLKKVYLRFNPMKVDEAARDYEINLVDENGSQKWLSHQDKEIDIAVIDIDIRKLKEEAMQAGYFHGDAQVANVEKLNDLGIIEGDFVYVLGFPMGLVGGTRNMVIARSGTIARIRDVLTRNSKEFLVDAFVFPGNSGGPVVSKPEAIAITGTKSQNASYLIGIIKHYVPYMDVAYSKQTNRPRIIFEENSGLAAAHPIDFVEEIIASYIASHSEELTLLFQQAQ